MRLVPRRAGGGAPGAGRRWVRSLTKTSGAWLMTLGLVAGRVELAALAIGAGAVVAGGFLGAFGRERRALHDRLTGTEIARG
jgi:hypothetical protein